VKVRLAGLWAAMMLLYGYATCCSGLLEISFTLTIVATAWNWPRRDSSAAAA
jgi:hypothetical protein